MQVIFDQSGIFRFLFSAILVTTGVSATLAQNEISPEARKKLQANTFQQQEGEEGVETGLLNRDNDQIKSTAEIRSLWTKVKAGDPQAQYALGIKALRGQGFQKSTRQGMYLLGQAADQNHAEALFELLMNYASRVGLPLDLDEARSLLDRKADHVATFFKNPKFTPYQKALVLDWYVRSCKIMAPKEDRKIAFDKLRSHFAKEFPDSSILNYVDGDFFVEYAWDARTGKWAHEVTEEQFKEFGNMLYRAKDALEKSYEMDRKNFLAASKMIPVMMGLSRPRSEMEEWFDRATTANPKFLYSYNAKMTYLEPKWLGSAEEMIEFGRECVKNGQWKTNIPFQLIGAHERLSAYIPREPEKPNTDPRYPYFERQGVWEDIRLVCDGYLKDNPENLLIRSKYARYACMCKKWSAAKEQFDILGDKIDQSVFAAEHEYASYKEMANR